VGAIREPMNRPKMRFVPVKSADDRAALMLIKVRDLLVKQRTMLINAIRAHAGELGGIGAKGPQRIVVLLQPIGEDANLPALPRAMLGELAGQPAALEARLARPRSQLIALEKAGPRS
jgi:transposase